MGHSDSKLIPAPQLSPEGASKGIPPVIRITYQKSWTKLVCFARISLNLGEPNAEPMYSISFPKGLYGDIILHNGPNIESPPLARSTKDGNCRTDYAISLPTLSGNGVQEEILRRPQGMKGRWWFGIQVGNGPDQHIERFEWRRSRGAEVKSVGQSSWGGYKLVRLGNANHKEEYYSSSDEDLPEDSNRNSGEGFTSDGKEIVAVWGSASCYKSFSGVGEFQFRGSGATGELGTIWALMAVMSCMSIWQKAQRDAATAGAAASSSSSSSAAAAAASA
ncbi:hypothetical protein FSARC_12378 [Fusarium sarcochroum]|uniref:Uncharacterized protein n=1 Tax=Fusarium sarcochroum TaxID=1208366 RepID=A0A8H4T8T5_9HYPO|nr:hypothetical protein FSARC_12378 [Fusarium sarcochroum]